MSHDVPQYSVLVVDDEPEWVEDMQSQGRAIGASHVKYDVITDETAALSRLHDDNSYDLVIVDLYLKNGFGPDVIQRARELGVTIPFAIVSHQARESLEQDNGALFSKYLSSGAVQYLWKEQIGELGRFNDLVVTTIQAVGGMIDSLSANLEVRQRFADGLVGETAELTEVIATYARELADPASFIRLCDQVVENSRTVRLALSPASPFTEFAEPGYKKHYHYYDLYPSAGDRLEMQMSLKALQRRKWQSEDSGARVAVSVARILSDASRRRSRSDVATRIFAAFADELQRQGDTNGAVNVLNALYTELKRQGLKGASVGAKILIVLTLSKAGRFRSAKLSFDSAYLEATKHGLSDYVEYMNVHEKALVHE